MVAFKEEFPYLRGDSGQLFEFDQAWRVLAPGGVIVADDIDFNLAFGQFAARAAGSQAIIARHDDIDRLFGMLVRERAGLASQSVSDRRRTRAFR